MAAAPRPHGRNLCACGLVLVVLGSLAASGCATPRSVWSRLPNPPPAETAQPVAFENSHEAASFLAMPGDIVVLNLGSSRMASALKQLGAYPAGVMDLLSLNNPFTTYLHAEIVLDIEDARRLKTLGFYPLLKHYRQDMYWRDYAIFRVGDFPETSSRALNKVASRRYRETGFCGDFIAWCFDDAIYSWWNQVPVVRRVFVKLYPPEAIQTPDRLAASPQTRLVCMVRQGRLVYPAQVQTADVLRHSQAGLKDPHPAIQRHSAAVLDRLVNSGAVDSSHEVRKPYIALRARLP